MYHYFEDKQDLFNFLIEFSVKELIDAFNKNFDWNETDLLERISQGIKVKFNMCLHYPYLIDFCRIALEKKSISELRNSARLEYSILHDKFYTDNVDLSKFKDDIDVDRAIDVIRWTMQKHSEGYQEKMNSGVSNIDLEVIFKETEKYIEFLRKTFYSKNI